MARVKLNKKFEKYTGTPPPNGSRFYLTNRYGETVMSHYPMHKDPSTITDKQVASCNLHTQAVQLADADLHDPVKHDEWLQKWHTSLSDSRAKHYKTLRGFVIAAYRQQL